MDPITHFLIGAVTSQAFFARRLGRLAPLVGGVAGILADADRLIYLPASPLTMMNVHQQFTHALWFIPIGGLIAMLPFFWLKQFRYRRRALMTASMVCFATHGACDVLSSQGTAVFWPLSDWRLALDWLPYFDPLLLVILLAGVIAGLVKVDPRFGKAAFIAALFYTGVGAAQHERAIGVQKQIADSRLQTPNEKRVIPTQYNLVVWRSLYKINNQIYVDAIRVPLTGSEPSYRQGQWVRTFSVHLLPKALRNTSQETQARLLTDLADQWVGFVPKTNGVKSPLMDIRLSPRPEGIEGTLGLQMNEITPDEPALFVTIASADPTPWSSKWHDLASPTAAALPKHAKRAYRSTRTRQNSKPRNDAATVSGQQKSKKQTPDPDAFVPVPTRSDN